VLFTEGQTVKKGDVIALVDPRPFTIQLHTAEATLAKDDSLLKNGQLNLERYETLRKGNLIPQQQVDDQRALVAQLEATTHADKAQIENARLMLDYARITSPLAGRVGLRLVDAGNMVSASSTTGLLVITQVEPIAVLFTVPEDALRLLLPKIRQGQDLAAEVFDRGGATHLATGKVQTLDNQIDPTTGTVRIKAVFDNKDHLLFPSQFVNVQLVADVRKDQVVVPAVAVQHGPQGAFVYVVRNGTAAVRPVTVGVVEADRASIDRGLDAGETVVTDSTDRLRDGSAIEVRAAAPGGGAGRSGGGQATGSHRRRPQ